MKNLLKKFTHYFTKLIYPNGIKCIFCGDELNQNEYNSTCESCLKKLPFINNYCEKCGNPIRKDEIGVCFSCKTTNYNFNKARSVFVYIDEVLKTIHKFKYNNGKYLYKPLAKFMLEFYATQSMFADCVTYVPMFKKKEKLRGYNQAKLLANEFANNLNIPIFDFCEKVIDNESQTSLDLKERRENVKDTFKFKTEFKKDIKDKVVLIIDDIFTTGATSNEISKILINAGAKDCFVLTLAHTPLGEKELNSLSKPNK